MPIKITYIITGLGLGGSENMLYKLLRYSDKNCITSSLICLTKESDLAEKIQSCGIDVTVLPYENRWYNLPIMLVRCVVILRKLRPDIVHTWLYQANVVGGLAAYFLHNRPITIWNLRNTVSGVSNASQKIFFTLVRLCSHFIPDHILSCSQRGAQEHNGVGIRQKIAIIHNGFEEKVLSKLSDRNIKKIGIVARFTPEKDYHTFLKAASYLHKSYPNCQFLLVGKGCNSSNIFFQKWILEYELCNCIELIEPPVDIDAILEDLDIFTLSSYSEGFPNVIGEAMTKGIPCVSTDAGDAAILIDNPELIVPIHNPEMLALAWEKVLLMPLSERIALGLSLRKRIYQHFLIDDIVNQYDEWHKNLF